jgi:hypothetical protein
LFIRECFLFQRLELTQQLEPLLLDGRSHLHLAEKRLPGIERQYSVIYMKIPSFKDVHGLIRTSTPANRPKARIST